MRPLVTAAVAAVAVAGLAAAAGPGQARAATGPAATRTVTYHGLSLQVPSTWPVYHLASDPSRCVLLDTHAVYLGQPGSSQRCPARAVGERTEALWVRPIGASATLPPDTVALGHPGDATRLAADPDHTWQVALRQPGVLVTASYGRHPGTVRAMLAGARAGAPQASSPAPQASPSTQSAPPAQSASASPPASAPAVTSSPPPPSSRELVRGELAQARGFDACTAPPVPTMQAWLNSPYRVIGTYLGGVNWACTYGNFSRDWVQQVSRMGWRFIPIYVGLQAPCSGIGATIDPAEAGPEGSASAADAAVLARQFGYASGSPIYLDMEGYNSRDATCRQAVLTFVSSWTAALHQQGYLSGVYSSAASGIADLASAYNTPGYARPDDIWIGHWNGEPTLADPYVPASDWASHQRLHQFYGSHDETWGGATVNVDDDVIDGAVAGRPGPVPSPGFVLARPSAATVGPGASTTLTLTAGRDHGNPGPEGALRWQAHPPSGLTLTPSQGVLSPAGPRSSQAVTVSAAPGLPPGRYDVAITAMDGPAPAAETSVLVSVTPAGTTLTDPVPLRLYAASPADMAVAEHLAGEMALPGSDLTGSFSTAWTDLLSGRYLVLAVGAAADNALYLNPCGWPNPGNESAGATPFYYVGAPFRSRPGADAYENAAGATVAQTARLASALAHYALAGTLPNQGPLPPGPAGPQDVCTGQPDVPVP